MIVSIRAASSGLSDSPSLIDRRTLSFVDVFLIRITSLFQTRERLYTLKLPRGFNHTRIGSLWLYSVDSD